MRFAQNLTFATPDTIRQELLHFVDHVLQRIQRKQYALDQLKSMREFLDSLPVANPEYGIAVSRFRNAHRFLVSQEPGAARYELQLLASTLRNSNDGDSWPSLRKQAAETGRFFQFEG